MIRTRLASLALATGLGLVCGCYSLSERPLLSRFRATPVCCTNGGCESGCCGAAGEGPILEGVPPPPPPPDTAIPFPTAPPRLVPTPQSPVMPYVPDGR